MPAPPTPPGLVGAWGFSEGSGTTSADASGNGNTATLLNGPTWVAGKYGSGLSLDGANDNLSIANSASLNISGSALTLSMWINPATITGDSVVLGKFWNAGMTSPYYQYASSCPAGGRISLSAPQPGSSEPTWTAPWRSTNGVTWRSSFNGSQAQFYVNGTLGRHQAAHRDHDSARPADASRCRCVSLAVLSGRPRQPADLQPDTDRVGASKRHEHGSRRGRPARHDAAVDTVGADRHGGERDPDQPQLERLHRQRRRQPSTASSAAPAPAAPPSRRSAPRPAPRSTTPA